MWNLRPNEMKRKVQNHIRSLSEKLYQHSDPLTPSSEYRLDVDFTPGLPEGNTGQEVISKVEGKARSRKLGLLLSWPHVRWTSSGAGQPAPDCSQVGIWSGTNTHLQVETGDVLRPSCVVTEAPAVVEWASLESAKTNLIVLRLLDVWGLLGAVFMRVEWRFCHPRLKHIRMCIEKT